jgi:hypothetical protein
MLQNSKKARICGGYGMDERTALRHAFMDVELRTERCARLKEGKYTNEKTFKSAWEISPCLGLYQATSVIGRCLELHRLRPDRWTNTALRASAFYKRSYDWAQNRKKSKTPVDLKMHVIHRNARPRKLLMFCSIPKL